MRILHSSDWHIGKKLYEIDLEADLVFFFENLIQIIQSKQIDILIVSGDIFDTAYPSNSALNLYYRTLIRLSNTGLKHIFIIGGNHDSVSTLEAPKPVLEAVNVHVIGGVPKTEKDENDYEQEIYEIKNEIGSTELVICAVPFLRERDIRINNSGENALERAKSINDGIKNHFSIIAQHVKRYKEKNIPILVTGHLFVAGSSNSDSEREIYAGNLAKIDSSIFDPVFDYVALGHIHRPQTVNKNPKIRYSGSPIPLSFSEREDKKMLLCIQTTESNDLEVSEIELPFFRKLLHFSGTFEDIKMKISKLQNVQISKDLCEVEIFEKQYIPDLINSVQQYFAELETIQIAHFKIQFAENNAGLDEFFDTTQSIKDLSDIEVFEKRLDNENIENKEDILQTYYEIKQIISQNP